jgi:hypothetical protein
MVEADVVIAWFCNGGVAKDAFTRPTRFVQMPTPPNREYDKQIASFGQQPLRNLLKMYAPDVRPLRIAVMGFSEGCQGARALLRSADGRRVDSALFFDGIHAQFQPGSKKALEPAYLSAITAFARMAAEGARLFVDTTSSIVPPYPTVSTSMTADWIWREITGSTEPEQQHPLPEGAVQHFDPPVVYQAGSAKGGLTWPRTEYELAPIYQFRNRGSAWILNYSNLDPTGHNDHILQAEHVLPMALRLFLAQRWNQIAPEQGICVLSADDPASPAPEPLPVGCFASTRLSDLYLSGQAEPAYLDTDAYPDPVIPEIAAIGPVEPESSGTDVYGSAVKWIGGLVASALVIEGARRLGSWFASHARDNADPRS